MFQCFSPLSADVQQPANAASSSDVNLLVIPETMQLDKEVSNVQSFDLALSDTAETGSVSSWSVLSDHAWF